MHKTMKKNRNRQASVMSLYIEILDDNVLFNTITGLACVPDLWNASYWIKYIRRGKLIARKHTYYIFSWAPKSPGPPVNYPGYPQLFDAPAAQGRVIEFYCNDLKSDSLYCRAKQKPAEDKRSKAMKPFFSCFAQQQCPIQFMISFFELTRKECKQMCKTQLLLLS